MLNEMHSVAGIPIQGLNYVLINKYLSVSSFCAALSWNHEKRQQKQPQT